MNNEDELKTHKFLSPQVRILGGRRNGKVLVAAYQQGWNDAIDAIVDNEPTVCNDNYSMGYQDGVKTVLSERPHGEWLKVKEEVHYDYFTVCECSLCKHSWALGELSIEGVKADYKFCLNCGTDMRKEGRE